MTTLVSIGGETGHWKELLQLTLTTIWKTRGHSGKTRIERSLALDDANGFVLFVSELFDPSTTKDTCPKRLDKTNNNMWLLLLYMMITTIDRSKVYSFSLLQTVWNLVLVWDIVVVIMPLVFVWYLCQQWHNNRARIHQTKEQELKLVFTNDGVKHKQTILREKSMGSGGQWDKRPVVLRAEQFREESVASRFCECTPGDRS